MCELAKGAGFLDTLLHGVRAVGIKGKAERGGVERDVYRGLFSRIGRRGINLQDIHHLGEQEWQWLQGL